MIELTIEKYCQDCLHFEPCRVGPDIYTDMDGGEYIFGITEVQCVHRNKCEKIYNYLEKQVKGEKNE